MTFYWVTLRFHASGAELTQSFSSALERALVIIATQAYADVVRQGEA